MRPNKICIYLFYSTVTNKRFVLEQHLHFISPQKHFLHCYVSFLFLSEDIRKYGAYNGEPEIGDLMEWIASEVCPLLRVLPVVMLFKECNCCTPFHYIIILVCTNFHTSGNTSIKVCTNLNWFDFHGGTEPSLQVVCIKF